MIDRRQFVGLGALAAGAAATGAWSDALAQSASQMASGPVVETTAGKVRGANLGKVQAFKGVPYGASTAPPNRFMPPQKPKAWTGSAIARRSASAPRSCSPTSTASCRPRSRPWTATSPWAKTA